MFGKLGPLAAMLLLVAIFAVGCGGDDNSDSSGDDAPAVTATTADDGGTETAVSTTETAEAPALDDENLEKGIEACKNSVDTNPSVADDLKDDLKEVCDSIRSGDPEEMQRITREVCEKIVEGSVEAGAIRDQAMEACSATG